MDPWTVVPLAAVAVATVGYEVGYRRTRSMLRAHRLTGRIVRPWRHAAFLAAMAVLAVALSPQLDAYADRRLWVHMTQHVLLMNAAAPLLVLSAPWLVTARALPIGARRSLLRGVIHGSWAGPLRAVARFVRRPAVSWVIFALALLPWHLPAAYDAAEAHPGIHALQHICFFWGAGVLFWTQIIDSPPLRSSLNHPRRIAALFYATAVGWVLAVVMEYAGQPFYPHYVVSDGGAGAALADQQLAAAVMWVPAGLPYAIAIFWAAYQWLVDQDSVPAVIDSVLGGNAGRIPLLSAGGREHQWH